ncbi:MAG: hypothetical protein VYE64_06590 [Planctomycetota bacterium]|nr:hypothetical protein [Planctomycetota bacterium]
MRISPVAGLFLMAVILPGLLATHADASIYNDNWQAELRVSSFTDSVTGARFTANKGWTIEAGADDYFREQYERPTSQGFQSTVNGLPAFDKYYEPLDIVSGQFAVDSLSQVAYFSIDLNGQDEKTADGSSDFVGFKHF